MKKIISLSFSALLVLIDQLTKWLSVRHLKGQAPLPILEGVFELQYCENPGVAFSLLENKRWVFIPVTLAVALIVLIMLLRSPLCRYKTFSLCCVLILAGGIGNLIDRIAYGYVIDFLYFKLIDFPIFNFADCCVVIGACLLMIFVIFLFKDTDNAPLSTLLFGFKSKKETKNEGE